MNANIIAQTLNTVQAILGWLTSRGMRKDAVQRLLDAAAASGEDITTAAVQAELDITSAELDETEAAINDAD